MARSRSPDIPGEHVEVAYRVVSHATVSGPPETCRSPQLSPTSGFACAAIQQLRACGCAFSKPSPPEKSSDSRRICVRNHQDSAADEVLSRRSSPFKLSDMRQRYGAGSALAAETQDQGDAAERRAAREGRSRDS